MRDFWDARLAYEHRALVASPPAIVADWAMVVAFTHDDLTPSIKALGYTRIPALREPDAVSRARVRIAIVDAGCDSPVT